VGCESFLEGSHGDRAHVQDGAGSHRALHHVKGHYFHRTLADGWAYARFYESETERRAALPDWIHFYNHHRHHSAVGGPPISRLNNLPGHHS